MSDIVVGTLITALFYFLYIFAHETWPVSGWLALSATSLYGIKKIQTYLLKRWPTKSSEPINNVIKLTIDGFRVALICITYVLSVLTLVQFIINIFPIDESYVRKYESILMAVQYYLKSILDIKLLIVSTIILCIFKSYLHNLDNPLTFFREKIEQLLIIIATLTSFTFFASHSVSSYEESWSNNIIHEAEARLTSIEESQKKLVSAAYVEEKINKIDSKSQLDLSNLFQRIQKENPAPNVSNLFAKELGRIIANAAPKIELQHSAISDFLLDSPLMNPSIASVMQHDKLKSKLAELRKSLSLFKENKTKESLLKLDEAITKSNELDNVLTEQNKKFIETISKSLSSLLPENTHPMLEPFLSTLIESFAKVSLSRVSGSVFDIASASKSLPDYP